MVPSRQQPHKVAVRMLHVNADMNVDANALADKLGLDLYSRLKPCDPAPAQLPLVALTADPFEREAGTGNPYL